MKNTFQGFSNFAELSSNEIEDLKRGSWAIECSKMILKSRSPNNPPTFSGAGFVRQTSDHQLEFKLYSSRQLNTKWGGGHLPFVAGKVIPDWAFYDLTVQDFKGRSWTSTRLLPDFNWTATGKSIIEGRLPELTCQINVPKPFPHKGSRLELEILDNAEMPSNKLTKRRESIAGHLRTKSVSLNAWNFKSCGFDFLLTKETSDSLTVEVYSNSKAFPIYFEDRVVETLQFVFGRPFYWLIMQRRIGRKKSTVLSLVIIHISSFPLEKDGRVRIESSRLSAIRR